MQQASLNFEVPRSRRSDPPSSHRAESEMRKSGAMESQARFVWIIMRTHPGNSSRQLSELRKADRHMVARRCSDLWRKGHALKVEIGKQDCKWYAIL
jgi:hypothetical protein